MTTFRIDKNHNLVIELDEGDSDDIKYWREQGRTDYEIFPDLIEWKLCNSGWEFVTPSEIGALISDYDYVLTEEAERNDHGELLKVGWVYWNPNSAIVSEVEELLRYGKITFQGIE